MKKHLKRMAARENRVSLPAIYPPAAARRGMLHRFLLLAGVSLLCHAKVSAQVPVVSSVSPQVGFPASTITITGTGFHTTAASNAVYFGATKATVSAASATSLTVTVPVGATFAPVTVLNMSNWLTGYSMLHFLPSYDGSGNEPNTVNFDTRVDITTSISGQPYNVAIGDFDGDGKPDMAVLNNSTSTISVFRNTSSSGSIAASSFASPVTVSVAISPLSIEAADMDGDGRLDMVVASNTTAGLSVFRNTSPGAGTISFGTAVTGTLSGAGRVVAVGDIDGDGLPDVAVGQNGVAITVFRNTSTTGFVSLSAPVTLSLAVNSSGVRIADIDGDGKRDLLMASQGTALYVYRNIATSGSISASSFASPVTFTTGSVSDKQQIEVADIDGDGKMDVLTMAGTVISVFRNTATSGSITSSSLATPVEITGAGVIKLADFNGDGKPDIASKVTGTTSGVRLNKSTVGSISASSFSAAVGFPTSTSQLGMGAADLDGDGLPEMLVCSGASTSVISIFRNDPLKPITGATALCAAGSTTTLANATPGGTWSSSATGVATVGSGTGLVTAIAAGTAIISYIGTAGATYAGNIATVVVAVGATTVTGVTPLTGYAGSSVTITGSGFSTTPASNTVWFGATRATVTAASATSLTVTVPAGATFAPVTVMAANCGTNYTGYSRYPFLPSYNGSTNAPGTVNFASKIDITAGDASMNVAIGDLNGDGKGDIVASSNGGNIVSVYENTSSSGSLAASSFSTKIDIAVPAGPRGVALGDIDNDGNLDIVVTPASGSFSVIRSTGAGGHITASSFAARVDITRTGSGMFFVALRDIDGDGRTDVAFNNNGTNGVSIFRNTSAPGAVSFAAQLDIASNVNPRMVSFGDLDGDGKADLAMAHGSSNKLSVFRNISTPGTLTAASFAAKVDLTVTNGQGVAMADLDNDGKLDITTADNGGTTVSVFRNTSTVGSLSFAAATTSTAGSSVTDVMATDVDGDSKPDIVVVNSASATVSVLRNTSASAGTISLAAKTDFAINTNGQMMAIGDLDGDSRPDLVVGHGTGTAFTIHRNNPLSPITGTLTVGRCTSTTLANATTGGTWTSSNTGVATVGSGTGVVTAVANGTAIISYIGTAGASFAGNIATAIVTVAAASIISVSPLTAAAGASVTITGTGFDATATNNVVWFGATRGTVTAATATSLTVTVPVGATWGPVTVKVGSCNAIASSQLAFLPTYNGSSYVAGTVNFDGKVDLPADLRPIDPVIADFDGDGKADIATTTHGANTVSVFRNTSSSGTLTAGSFASLVWVATGSGPNNMNAADIDGDGKLDMIVGNNSSSSVSIFRNTSTGVGSISFATAVTTAVSGGARRMAVGDIDGDGLQDIAVSQNANVFTVFRNTSTAGAISLAAGVTFATPSSTSDVKIADIDGDGKRDLLVTTNGNVLYIYRNIATSGSISAASFAASVSFTAGNVMEVTDVDGDGKLDVLTTNTSGLSIFRNIATSGTISASSLAAKVDIAGIIGFMTIADFNGDGKPDVAAKSASGAFNGVMLNNATSGTINTSSFSAVTSFATSVGVTSIAAGDLDGDGFADIVAPNGTGTTTISILRNNPLSPIGGTLSVCAAGTTTLTNTAGGGTWSSSNTSIATVGSANGVVSGVAAGTAVITYAGTAGASFAGNIATAVVTVQTAVTPGSGSIGGTGTVCVGATTALSVTGISGGAWSSSNPASGTVSSTGVVSGIAAGTTTISYMVSNACGAVTVTTNVTVSPLAVAGTISGGESVCVGKSVALSSSGASGGAWISGSPAVATVSATGTVTGVSTGWTTISYTVTTGCGAATATVNVWVNANAPIEGGTSVCAGAYTLLTNEVSGGSWASSNTAVGTVNLLGVVTGKAGGTTNITYTNGAGCIETVVVTVTQPAITASASGIICGTGSATLTASGGSSYSWSPAGTLSSGMGASVTASPAITTVYTVTGFDDAGCSNTATVNAVVSAAPAAITGAMAIVPSGSTVLSSSPSGGVWSSSNTGVATTSPVGAGASCIVTATGSGVSNITYTLPGGCYTAAQVTVALASINGPGTACVGGSVTYTHAVTGGTWSVSPGTVAHINSTSGALTGVSSGTAVITYTAGSLVQTKTVTVAAITPAISGASGVCTGSATTLTATPAGGTWSSAASTVSVNGTTGMVTGVSAGVAVVTYSVSGCTATRTLTINAISPITGDATVCVGGTVTLGNTTGGGTWSSSITAKATIAGGSGIVTPMSAGTTTITYATSATCYATMVMSVVSVPGALTGISPVCTGDSALLFYPSYGGTWSSSNLTVATVTSYTGEDITGGTGGRVTGIGAGTTTITYRISAGCFKTVVVSVSPLPAAIGGTTAVCVGSSGYLSNAATGEWYSDNTSVATTWGGILTGVSAGTTIVTFIQSGTGCSTSRVVTVNALPGAISGSNNICVSGTSAYTNSAPGGTWSSSAAATTSTTSSPGVFIGNALGTARITYTVAGGCIATKPVTVVASPSSISGTLSMCKGGNTTLSSTTVNQTWSSGNTSVAQIGAVGTTTGTIEGVNTGTAVISYTNANGCSATKVVTVTAPLASITGSAGVCIGGSATLAHTVSGGTYASSAPAVASITTSGVYTGASAGTATITYRTAATCFTTTTVSVAAAPSASITGPTGVCVGSAITLAHATTGGTWSSSTTAKATINAVTGEVTGVSAGTATITYYTNASCYVTRVVTVSAGPVISTSVPAVCEGATVTFGTTTPGGSWISNNGFASIGSASGVVTGVASGVSVISYVVSGTGCAATKSITVNPAPAAVTGASPMCPGATQTWSSLPAGGTWASSATGVATASGTTGVVTGVAAGTANITYTLASGCSRVHVATVNAIPGALTGAFVLCQGATTSIVAANAGLAWSSSNGSIATVGSTSAIAALVTGVATGTATISYAFSATGCARTVVVTVTTPPPAISGHDIVCVGNTINLNNTVVGGTWSGGTSGIATVAAGGIVTGSGAGTANITYNLGTGCFTAKTITVNPAPAAITGPANVCMDENITLTMPPSGGTWSSSNNSVATVGTDGVVSGNAVGTATITCAPSPGCRSTKIITVLALPASISGTAMVCVGATTTLSCATAGGTWSSASPLRAVISSNGVVTGVAATGNATMRYTITATGCRTTRLVTINAMPDVTGTSVVCAGSVTNLSATPGAGTWATSAGIVATVNTAGVVTGTGQGTANITYTSPAGCKAAKPVTVNPQPGNISSKQSSVNELSSITFSNATAGGTWSSSSSAIATVGSTGIVTGQATGVATITYTLTATGCYRTRVVTVNPFGSRGASVEQGGTAIRIFPNPTSGMLTVEAGVNGTFSIYAIDGKKVEQFAVASPATQVALPAHLAAGVYMCRFEGEDGSTAIVQIVFTP